MKKAFKVILTVFAILVVVIMVGPFLVPVQPLEGLLTPQELADPDSQFVTLDGLQVHVKMQGQGDPVFVLLHGFGASLFSWHAVMPSMAENGTVIAYDRPAFGLTERPMEWDGESPYSLQANTNLLLALLDHYDVDKAILVGNSAGGTVAMTFTLQHPDRVKALILVDPAVYAGGGGPTWIQPLYRTPQVQHLGPLLVRSIQERGLDIIQIAWHNPSLITPEILNGYTKPLQIENWDRALWFFTASSQPAGLVERLGEFTLPVLLITGDDDRIVPTADSIRLAEELPSASLVVIPNAGHVPHEERPDLFLQAVHAFITSLP